MTYEAEMQAAIEHGNVILGAPFRRSKQPAPEPPSFVRLDEYPLDFSSKGVIGGLLAHGSMSVLYGASNGGKTFVAVDIACRVAAGEPWHGLPVSQGTVVYVAAENAQSIATRCKAWEIHHDRQDLPLYIVPPHIDLFDEAGSTDALIEGIKQLPEPVTLIVIDTLARCMGAGDENAAADIGLLVQHVDKLRSALGCHVLVVHHTGKNEANGARGSSALRAATDTELECADFVLTVRKQRDTAGGESYAFSKETVTVPDFNGYTRETIVLSSADAPPVGKKSTDAKLPSGAQNVLAAIIETMNQSGMPAPGHEEMNGTNVVCTLKAAQTRFYATSSLETDGAKRMAFNRGIERLQAAKRVKIWTSYVWAT